MKDGKIISDIEAKIQDLPNRYFQEYLHMSKEMLIKKMERENAALVTCGALLGNCHLMAETIDWILSDTDDGKTKRRDLILSQPWCRHKIKMNFKKAMQEITTTINNSRRNSQSDPDYMNDVSDNMYQELKPDIFKLYNAILIELGRVKFKKECDKGAVAYLILIMLLLQWIAYYYDNVIKYMKGVYSDADYNSWYNRARCTVASKLWDKIVNDVLNEIGDGNDLDLSNCSSIVNGLKVIDNKMRDEEVATKVTMDSGEHEEDKGFKTITQAFDMLGLK